MRITFVFCLLAFAAVPSHAQNGTDCSSLMRFGVYDKYKTFSTESHYKQVQQFFSSFQFSSTQEAQSKAADLGLDIKDVLNLNFHGTTANTNFQQWQQEIVKSSYLEAISSGLKAESIEKISSAMTDLVGKCLTQSGVHAYVIPAADNQTFSVTVDFVPTGSAHPSTKGTLTLLPASVAASCTPHDLIGKQVDIGIQGISISCRRLPTETVAITANTDDGSPAIHYDAYVVPPLSVNFSSTKDTIQAGESTALIWNVANASRVEIEEFGAVTPSGTLSVSPNATKLYRLIATSLDGKQTSTFKTITVLPPPPVLTGARVFFHTTDNDKDGDTTVSVYIICGGTTVAAVSGMFGHWDDNSDSGWINLNVVERPRRDGMIGVCRAQLVEAPRGHDEWHFNWTLELTFSDGSTKRYDWGGGNVDYDRGTITQPL